MLDEHELPADLDPDLAAYIQTTKAFILQHYREIIQEADSAIEKILSDKP